ncbi:MAG TPA: YtxH domain-containing protein [Anaerolineales bacterium]|nr:YtxH domain-containing protein [Anaerolineales bacterium]
MKRMLSFLSGAIMGALVGSTLAVLLAPSSGEDIRRQLQERVSTIQKEIQKAASERRAELEEQLAAMRAPQKPGGV